MNKVIGWTGTYTSSYKTVPFTVDRQQALVELIKRRHYNFTHFDYEYMDYCCPVYEDKKICTLTKAQFDEVMHKAYATMPIGTRLMPSDVIKREPINGTLYEKSDYEPKDGENNG